MGKYSKTAIPLPLPPTTKDKFAIYLSIEGEVEMFLYDGKQVFTPDFPDIPIVQIDLLDGRTVTQQTLASICKHLMEQQEVVYNEQYNLWEALDSNPF